MKFASVLLISLFTLPTLAQENNWELKADSIVEVSKSQLGTPYKWGTSSPNTSFDCSGFTSYVFNSVNVPNSRSSKAYASLGKQVPLAQCRKGDCLVFSGTAPGSRTPGHVGIVVSNDEEGLKFIHCSSSKKHFGVVITDYFDSNYPNRFLQVRRLFE